MSGPMVSSHTFDAIVMAAVLVSLIAWVIGIAVSGRRK